MKRYFYYLLFMGILPALWAQSQPDPVFDQPIHADFQNQNLLEILYQLEQDYTVSFFFKEEWIPRKNLTASFSGESLQEALDVLLAETDLSYLRYDQRAVIIGYQSALQGLSAFSFENYVSEVDAISQEAALSHLDLVQLGDSTIRPRPREAVLRGLVYNQETDEAQASGKISFPNLDTGSFCDSTGRFEIRVPTGRHLVQVEATGHEAFQTHIDIFSDANWEVSLNYTAFQLEEVLLEAETEGQNLDNVQAGRVQLSMIEIRRSPALLGEIDIVNALLLLPGVSSVGEASTGFNVRGGNIDQNLMMQDGNMVFNSSHLLGFFSIFNPDVVQGVTLYKGHIPAQFGGRVSSVLDVDLMEGSYRNWKGRGSAGMFTSKLMLNGPIIKDKTSLVLAGRIAYPKLFLQYIQRNKDLVESNAWYGDLTFKLSHKVGNNGKFSLFSYGSNDFFRFSGDFGFNWRNFSVGANYQHILSDKSSLKLDVNRGTYRSDFFNPEGVQGSYHQTGVENTRAKFDYQYVPNRNHNIHAGLEGTYYNVLPNIREPFGENSSLLPIEAQKDQGLELGVYINDEIRLNPFVSISAGLRFSQYFNVGPHEVLSYEDGQEIRRENVTSSETFEAGEVMHSYNGLEPRLSARILFNESTSIKLSYNRVKQYMHLLSNTASATPIDVWQVSNRYFPDQTANNYSLGFFKNFQDRVWETSIEFFYRSMNGLVVTKDFAKLLSNPYIETEVLNAIGRAYGGELSVKRNLNKLKIEASFAYTRSFRMSTGNPEGLEINNGKWFPSDFDSPINITVSIKWRHLPSRTLAANFVYRTGRPVTVPVGVLSVPPSWDIPLFSERNTFRVPNYHRLDLSYTFDEGMISRRKTKSDFTFSIYNVYARENAFSIFFRKEGESFKAYQLAILGTALPFISYNFRF